MTMRRNTDHTWELKKKYKMDTRPSAHECHMTREIEFIAVVSVDKAHKPTPYSTFQAYEGMPPGLNTISNSSR